MQIKSVSASKSAEEMMSVDALMRSVSVRRPASRRWLRVNMRWLRRLARKMSCALEIDGLIVPRWFLELPPTTTLLALLM
jgi:hypothetical protein